MILITLFSLLFAGFVIWRGVWTLPLKRKWKCLISFPILLIALKFHLVRWIGGNFFSPSLGRGFLLTLTWLYSVMLLFFLLLLTGETLRAAVRLLRRFLPPVPAPAGKEKWPHFPLSPAGIFRLLLLAAALFLASWGIAEGTRVPEVAYETVFLPDGVCPQGALRIVLLTDLHADEVTRSDRIAAIVEKTNELSPDLIVITGDFADGRAVSVEQYLFPLRLLRAKYGVFGVPGNHEYFSEYSGAWLDALSSLGIRMLLNDSAILPCGIALAGISDESAQWRNEELPDWEKAWKRIPAGFPVIQLAHRPHWAEEACRRGAFLQLSGHTHGGMFFPLTLLVARQNAGFVSGRYELPGMTLIVSNGSGIWSGFPLRIGCPAQIVCIDLRAKR